MDDMTYTEWLETATETTVEKMPASKGFPDTFAQDGVLYVRVRFELLEIDEPVTVVMPVVSAVYKDERGRAVRVFA